MLAARRLMVHCGLIAQAADGAIGSAIALLDIIAPRRRLA